MKEILLSTTGNFVNNQALLIFKSRRLGRIFGQLLKQCVSQLKAVKVIYRIGNTLDSCFSRAANLKTGAQCQCGSQGISNWLLY